MKALFIGGTGTISMAIVRRLAEKTDWEVWLLNRGTRAVDVPESVHTITADINNEAEVAEKLKDLYFEDYIDVAVGVTENLKRKPAPDECYAAMEEMGVSNEDCIYVGDSDIDHQTAVNTGLPCISCLWGFRTKEELLDVFGDGDVTVKLWVEWTE